LTLNPAQAAFQTRIGHRFADPRLLAEALTHASLSVRAETSNERLEFLGDRVLGLVIAEALLAAYPDAAEGRLAPIYNALVRKETCAEVAAEIDLGPALMMGKSEAQSGGRKRLTLLADALEAVIAAVYLDGGHAAARAMVLRLWGDRIGTAEGRARDPKTALQEWAQARGLPPPDYRDIARQGPDHAPVFEIEATLTTGETERASAASKRAAQQIAAERLLARLEGGT
jgi:ribonuclease-3